MERTLGLDVHAASCTRAVISEKGRKLRDFPVESLAPGLLRRGAVNDGIENRRQQILVFQESSLKREDVTREIILGFDHGLNASQGFCQGTSEGRHLLIGTSDGALASRRGPLDQDGSDDQARGRRNAR